MLTPPLTLKSHCPLLASPKHTIAAWGWQSSLAGWSFLDLTRPWLSKTATKYYLMLHLFKVTSLATLMSPSLTESKIHEASFPVHVSYARTNVNSKSSAVTTTHLWHLICIWVFTTCHIATQTCNSSTQEVRREGHFTFQARVRTVSSKPAWDTELGLVTKNQNKTKHKAICHPQETVMLKKIEIEPILSTVPAPRFWHRIFI